MGFKVGGTSIIDNSGNIASTVGNIDGRDIAADGAKLDGIEASATADQTDAEIKTAYENNSDTNAFTDALLTKLNGIEDSATADQTKSDIDALNINADTLDGEHGSYYQTASTALGYITVADGDYGTIRVDDPRGVSWAGYKIRDDWLLMSNGADNCGIYNDTDNEWGILCRRNAEVEINYNGAMKAETRSNGFYVGGHLLASSNVYAYYSDERLKAKDGVIENALDKINSLETFYYYENDLAKEHGHDNDKRQLGVSAQQVKAVLPECVAPAPFDLETDNKGNEWSKSGEDYLTVDYPRLVPLLIKGIQEQQAQISELKQEIEELKNAPSE